MLLTEEEIEAGLASDDPEVLQMMHAALTEDYYTFEPRPDDPANHEEQTSFVDRNYFYSREERKYVYADNIRFKVMLGGNGSGKTVAAAHKTARHVLEMPPPRKMCPFWIIGEYMDQICKVAWVEKLKNVIPESNIYHIVSHRKDRGWPRAVILKHPDDENQPGWVLEFKSYEQGIGAMKGESIGGYWFNEEVPYSLVPEVMARCREYDSPGWADFTPVEYTPEWKEIYDNREMAPGWEFYHLNTFCNTTLPEGWVENVFLPNLPEDMRDSRTLGTFSTFAGQIFKEFSRKVHVIDPEKLEVRREFGLSGIEPFIPRDWYKIIGVDFGYNNPTCFLWVAKDHDQRYYVYDEHYRAGWLIHQHAVEVNKRKWQEGEPYYGPRFSEWENTSGARAEYARHGIHLVNARKAPREAIALLRSLMLVRGDSRPRFYVFQRCQNLIKELLSMRWRKGTDNNNARDEEVDKDNHAVDALRYAIFSDYRESGGKSLATSGRVDRDLKRYGIHLSKRSR